MVHHRPSLSLLILFAAGALAAQDPPASSPKAEPFDKDPGWEAFNNHIVPEGIPTIVQDFGYSGTRFAGKEAGEIGGRIMRTLRPAYYAAKIAPRTLDDKLSASGTFVITKASAGGGVFFGWFNAKQPEGAGRPIGSLGLHIDTESSGGRMAARLLTCSNEGCGTFVTPFGRYRTKEEKAENRPTAIHLGTMRYSWRIDYDPEGNAGSGRFTVTLKGDAEKAEEWEGKICMVDLPPGFRKSGTTFDHFGLANMTKPGGAMTIYFGDLEVGGMGQDFAKDPGWDGSGNHAMYEEPVKVGAHDFGYSATAFAGGAAGEVGGNLWRSGPYAYYADKVGPLSLDDRLEARGRVVLMVGAPDADMCFGWFNSADKEGSPSQSGHFLGVQVGGPTRVGHYFRPAVTTAEGTRALPASGPLLRQEKVYQWSLIYDPAGDGRIVATLGDEAVTLLLKQGLKAQGASFDRFGVFTENIGGQLIRIFLDDLTYTASR
jgi:hypothetical protein